MAKIAMTIPAQDIGPTKVAVSWKVLSDLGHEVVFAHPRWQAGRGRPDQLDGIGLDPWGRVPGCGGCGCWG